LNAFVTPGCSENIIDSDIYFSQFHYDRVFQNIVWHGA
jgi:hypothetical protein